MIEKLCSKSSITADTAFRKFYPAGVHKKQHTLDQPRKNQNKTQRGLHDKAITGFRIISGGHPLEYTRNEVSKLRDGLKVCDNGCKRQQIPKRGLSIPRKHSASKTVQRAPHTIVNKAVKHGIGTG